MGAHTAVHVCAGQERGCPGLCGQVGFLVIDTSGPWTVGVAPDGVSAAGTLQDDSGSSGALGVEPP